MGIKRQIDAANCEFETKGSKYLINVCGWLLINSFRSENMQANVVFQQNARNIWRKIVFSDLLLTFRKISDPIYMPYLEKAIDIFRERIDWSVESSVPISIGP